MNSTLRGLALFGLAAGLAGAATGCGLASPAHVATARSHVAGPSAAAVAAPQPEATRPVSSETVSPGAAAPSSNPSTPAASHYTGPHFSSPSSAMIYLAMAYNRRDATALHAVTTPESYRELTQMRPDMVHLQLRYCTRNPRRGDYICYFRHDYPARMHQSGHGASEMLIAPALNPGWYLYLVLECGSGAQMR
jgi:hypothetical protein